MIKSESLLSIKKKLLIFIHPVFITDIECFAGFQPDVMILPPLSSVEFCHWFQ